MEQQERYIPALGHERLTPLYDFVLRWVMRESTFKRRLIAQAHIAPGHRVLDMGCGTGTLTIMIKQTHPAAEVVGLDGDPEVLQIAQAKATKAGVAIKWDEGMAFALPYPDGSFDRVLSSLVFHHLASEDKRRTTREIFRVLRPGGELHVIDFGKPHNWLGSGIASIVGRLEQAADNVKGRLPEMFREAGFAAVEETSWFTTFVGPFSFYRARNQIHGGNQNDSNAIRVLDVCGYNVSGLW